MRKNVIRLAILAAMTVPFVSQAQEQKADREFYLRPSYWRPYDQRGINVFETSKEADTIPFEGLRFRIGAGFTQQFQNLEHKSLNPTVLYKMGAGFNLAMANLNTDVQLADGIRLHLASYLSTRHHNETWVKGGYIQFDKLPFKGQFWKGLMDVTTIKIGHMEINYGDQHFRRTDAGQALYNPFAENYIVDAFSTEIGGEIYVQKKGVFGMVGITNGTINSSINAQAPDFEGDSAKNPAVYFKAGIDKQITSQLRVRVSASAYYNQKSQRNVLYAGDRGGSNYWGVLEPDQTLTSGVWGKTSLTSNFTSGRLNPNFSRNVKAYMLNGLVKFGGAEVFGTYETAKGNAATAADPKERKFDQFAVDALYRFGAKENVFAGIRYNTVDARLAGYTADVNVKRTAFAAGWFLTRNVLLKGEYVKQKHSGFKTTDLRYGGKFNGYVIEAVVGF